MTLPDLDPEDKLSFPEGSGTATNLFTHIPGGAVTVGVLVLTAVAAFGLGMLAEHSIETQSTGLTGSAASSASAPSNLSAPGATPTQDTAANSANNLNTALPAGSASQ
jgi:hypothetical protein